MKDFLHVIRSSQLFSGISENELAIMLSCLDTKKESFPKDAFLLRVGDTAESIGLVLSGSVLIIQEDIWGNRNILLKAGPGQSFAAAYACAPGSVLNVKSSYMWDNALRVQNSCRIFPPKRSGSGNMNLTFLFQGSSLQITLG